MNPVNKDWYVEQILHEDKLLQDELEKNGLSVDRVAWDDRKFDFSTARVIMLRATWDYFQRMDEFTEWLDKVEKKTEILNSAGLIRWNIDKHYIGDLQGAGINTTPTIFIEQGDTVKLSALFKIVSYDDAVLKPCIGGGAYNTFRVNADNCTDLEETFQKLILDQAMMFQPFQKNILKNGEASHMIFGGKYTHSVIKKAKKGDYRVQDDFGGTVEDYKASPEEIAFAEMVITKMNPIPAYARVDVVKDNSNKLSVVELELIEPELWFRVKPEAAKVLADVITEKLQLVS
ncbi:MAG: hypothetical protein HKN22_01390 [Bacteroidia bacterium]|nr:hypothetical protein [Bacteroidia bacterium]